MIKNNHQINFVSTNKSLSILFNSDGFSFCIDDVETRQAISFGKYQFEKSIKAPEFLLSEILRIFANEKELQQDFKKITVIHQNNLATLVPKPFFDETKLKTYLDYTVKTFANDYIDFDEIPTVNAYNVYIPYVNINNYLLQNFGEFEFKHHSTVLIEKLIQRSTISDQDNFYVYVSEKSLDIIITKKDKLILKNSFEYNSPEDFIYYILFVAEQLELNPETFKLTFIGNINRNDVNYNITAKYVSIINFITIKSSFFDSSEKFSNHNNFILIS